MAETVPPWLISGFVRSATCLGATASRTELEQLAKELALTWSAPERTFHNLTHLKDTLENVDFLAEQARDTDVLRLTVWFHGFVFDVSEPAINRGEGGINAPACAKYAREKLGAIGIPVKTIDKVVSLMDGLYRHKPCDEIDAQVLSDADLSVLAADPEGYLRYLQAIREEYSAYSDSQYLKTRLQVVERLLARPQLFYTHMASTWEDQARENLRAEQERLLKSLGSSPDLQAAQISLGGQKTPTDTSTDKLPYPPAVYGKANGTPPDVAGDINPFAPTSEADLGSSLENVEEIMDTMVMKSLKNGGNAVKPMTNPET